MNDYEEVNIGRKYLDNEDRTVYYEDDDLYDSYGINRFNMIYNENDEIGIVFAKTGSFITNKKYEKFVLDGTFITYLMNDIKYDNLDKDNSTAIDYLYKNGCRIVNDLDLKNLQIYWLEPDIYFTLQKNDIKNCEELYIIYNNVESFDKFWFTGLPY